MELPKGVETVGARNERMNALIEEQVDILSDAIITKFESIPEDVRVVLYSKLASTILDEASRIIGNEDVEE